MRRSTRCWRGGDRRSHRRPRRHVRGDPAGAALSALSEPLDLLLAQAALGAVPRALPAGTAARFALALASRPSRPSRVAGRGASLLAELARVAAGASTVAPSGRDKRFSDPAWTQNPLLRRFVQAYLAAGEAVEGLAQDVPLGWRDAERVRFFTTNLVQALAPSNNPLVSPAAWKAALDTGGLSAVRGARNLVGSGQPVFAISWRNPDARHSIVGARRLRAGG